MKVVQLHLWIPKQFLNPKFNPKIAHRGPKKTKITPKLSKNQMPDLNETKKIKVFALYE